jgi:hypothetical protein
MEQHKTENTNTNFNTQRRNPQKDPNVKGTKNGAHPILYGH